jgi:hypothetical protein
LGILIIYAISIFASQEGWEEREVEKEVQKLERNNFQDDDEKFPLPDEKLDLNEFKKLGDEWNDRDFV